MRLPFQLPAHLVFGVLQSGLTSAVASFVASLPQITNGDVSHWIWSWLASWAVMLPLVVLAAPWLHRLARWISGKGGTASQPQAQETGSTARDSAMSLPRQQKTP